jgi:hypothetical protein
LPLSLASLITLSFGGQLQLNKKVKIFVYFAINDIVVLYEWGKPSASNSNCVVWVAIWEHLKNAIVWCLKE